MDKKYVVYITYYKGDKLPQWYIGSSYEEKVKKGYNGSVLSKKYKKIYDAEQKQNKHLFKTKILSYHKTREDALKEEKRLQRLHDVVKNEKYINASYAQENGFFGMDVSGLLNPNYGNKWDEEQKRKMSDNRKWKTIYIDVDGIPKLFHKINDRKYIEYYNLVHINKGKKYSDEVNYKKGSYFRGKKRPEHSEKMSGMSCHTAKIRGIYNELDELIYDVSGSLRKSIKKYNLPSSLEKATKEKPLNYYKNNQVKATAINNGFIKYNGWYVGCLLNKEKI